MSDAAAGCRLVLDRVGEAVVGKRGQLQLTLAAIVAGGHVLIEDNPGLGKTLLARSFAQALGMQFTRAQFTPDLLPSDLTGSYVYNQKQSEFEFRRGPMFTNLLLADEINRTPPKTQAALLESMQEHQVTIEGTTFELPQPFHVIATANPIEYEGTYTLPEAQLDRFLIRLSLGYPDIEEERGLVARRLGRRQELIRLEPVTDAAGLLGLQAAAEALTVEDTVQDYCVRLAAATRDYPDVLVGASPRASLALVLVARAYALTSGRDFVVPEDVKAVAVPVLAHRITVRPEVWMHGTTGSDVVRRVLAGVAAPVTARG